MNNVLKWLENIWKLKQIFDKYLPTIRAQSQAIHEMADQWKEMHEEIKALKAELKKQEQ